MDPETIQATYAPPPYGQPRPLGEEMAEAERNLEAMSARSDSRPSSRGGSQIISRAEFSGLRAEVSEVTNNLNNMFAMLQDMRQLMQGQGRIDQNGVAPPSLTTATSNEPLVATANTSNVTAIADNDVAAATRRLEEGRASRLQRAQLPTSGVPPTINPGGNEDIRVPRAWSQPPGTQTPPVRMTPLVTNAPSVIEPPRPADMVNTRGKALIKEPDTFDGTVPQNLKGFIRSLEHYFIAEPGRYGDDVVGASRMKVISATSFLRGMTADWVANQEMQNPRSPVVNDWNTFKKVFHETFGDLNERTNARTEIVTLTQSGKYATLQLYTLRFHQLSVLTGYEESVLRDFYWRGLNDELKDILYLKNEEEIESLTNLQSECFRQDRRLREKENARKERRFLRFATKDREEERKKGFRSSGNRDRSPRPSRHTEFQKNTTSTNRKTSSNGNSSKTLANRLGPKVSCYECQGNHLVRDCPRLSKSQITALREQLDDNESPPSGEDEDHQSFSEENSEQESTASDEDAGNGTGWAQSA